MCKGPHPIWNCEAFLKLKVDQRIEVVKEKRLCFNCLGPHKKTDCRSKYKCRECQMKHHTLIHDPSFTPPTSSVNTISSEQENPENTSTYSTTQLRGNVYLRILPVRVKAGNHNVTTLALLDDGSQTTLCSASLLKRLHAVTKPSEINIITIMGQSSKIRSSTTNLTVSSIEGEEGIELNEVKSLNKLPIGTDAAAHFDNTHNWEHLNDIIKNMKEQCKFRLQRPEDEIQQRNRRIPQWRLR